MGAEEWKIVRIVGSDEEATLIAGYLDGCGVPTEVESLLFHQEPVTFGRMGEVRIRVPAERFAEAERLLAELNGAGLGEAADAAELESEREGAEEP
jgi:hypothetical protein